MAWLIKFDDKAKKDLAAIDKASGYRVYFSRQGQVLVLLLCGSDKSEQSREITRAIAYLNDWKERGKP